jgi:hypothetical protein
LPGRDEIGTRSGGKRHTTFAEKVFLVNSAAAPVASTDGGVLYVEDGALKYRGPNSTTTIALA